MLIRCYKAD